MAISKLNPIEGGIPKGNTANRSVEFPSPQIGDVYYNGEVEALQIYNGTTWKVAKTEGFPPDAPTIASVTDSSTSLAYSSTAGTLDVIFVPAGTGGTPTQYNAYTTVGGHSGFTTVGSTVTITGLTPGTAYTVYGNAQNGSGTSTNTSNATPVTPTTLPQAPTIGTTTLTGGSPTVNWTLGNNGGKSLTAITITPYLNGTTAETSRTAATTSSTSYTFTSGQLTEDASYTFKVKVTNANGHSPESSASNSVIVDQVFSLDYLVVAGGGGGNRAEVNNPSGGGGAGGYRTSIGGTALSITPGIAYDIEIGAGGANQTGANGSKGGNSRFASIYATGGGGGSKEGTISGNGGSGGGDASASTNPAAGNEGGYTPPEGYAGGQASGDGGGGGGGAGGAAPDATSQFTNGSGGVGSSSASSWASITSSGVSGYFAGGGGGGSYAASNNTGTGGAGGGGDGKSRAGSGDDGVANTGGGGGAAGGNTPSNTGSKAGNGGSGIVIIKYPNDRTGTFSGGLTQTTYTSGGFKYTKITAGTGTVTF